MKILCYGGRTGTKVHAGDTCSSVLRCGKWLKSNCSYFRVKKQFAASDLCEKCFTEEQRNFTGKLTPEEFMHRG